MKLNTKSYWLALILMIVSAVPAFAQFEVSPDHFDDNPPSSPQADYSAIGLKVQIAEQKKLLANYQDRLLQKSVLVEKARQAFENYGSATARNDFLKQKSELRELRQSLAGPVRDTQLALARLRRQEQTLRASARARHAKGSATTVLSASK